MQPGQLLDMQADLAQRAEFEPDFRYVVHWQMALQFGAESGSKKTRDDAVRSADSGYDYLIASTKQAYAYRVTPDMCMLVQHAANELDDLDSFNDMLAPTPWGIVHFDQPMTLIDVRGVPQKMHWLIWGKSRTNLGPGVGFWQFNDVIDPDPATIESRKMEYADDATRERIWHAMGRWSFIGFGITMNGQRLGPPFALPSKTQIETLKKQGVEAHAGTNSARIIHALWMLLGQTVAASVDEYPDRAAKRRAVKKGFPPRVTVIHLRHKAHTQGEGESLVEWSHRWVVRGHWRWQPHGPLKSDDGHRHVMGRPEVITGRLMIRRCAHENCEHRWERTYIAPQVRGPADKPLVVSEKVYSLER